MIHKISGNFATHKKNFHGTVTIDSLTGIIKNVEEKIIEDASTSHFPVNQCLIFPGFGDIHVHCREDATGLQNYKEDFYSVGLSAINGGVTFLCDMPNNPKPPVDDDSYNEKLELTKKSEVFILPYAGIAKGSRPLSKNVPYKVYMGPSIGNLHFESNEELEDTIRYYKNCSVSFHCEDPEILRQSKHKSTHEQRRPSQAEINATEFALYLIEKYSISGKFCHFSTEKGLEKILKIKEKIQSIQIEVSPIHLFFDSEMITEVNKKFLQINPPIRDLIDKNTLLSELKKGNIDFLATDHAPHTIEEKLKGISGISQLDIYGLFVTYLLIEKKINVQTIVNVCSKNPGDFVNKFIQTNLSKGFGYIEEGYFANFSILNLTKNTIFQDYMIQSKSKCSPFSGFQFPGSIEAVYVKGIRKK